jgi:hypothetical protein
MPGFSSYPARGAASLLLGDKLITETADTPAATETITLEALGDFLLSRGFGKRLGGSNVAVSHTGDTNETTFATCTIPILQANDQLAVTALWTATSNANNKTTRIRFGGTGGTVIGSTVLTTNGQDRDWIEGGNRNSLSSQIWGLAGGGFAASGTANVTTAVNTGSSTTLVIRGLLANAADTLTLDQWRVTLWRTSS